MDGQHQNLDRTGYEGSTDIGGEQTEMKECGAECIQPSDRRWIKTEHIELFTVELRLVNFPLNILA